MRNRSALTAIAVVVVIGLVLGGVLVALTMRGPTAPTVSKPGPDPGVVHEPSRTGTDWEVPAEAVTTHLEAFQRIAEENGGNRGTGEPGYQASVDYVVTVLEDAGYQPELWEFEVPLEADLSELVVLGADRTTLGQVTGAGFTGARDGAATGTLTGVDLSAPRASSTSGCELDDFADLPAQAVALMRRGGCDFAVKARNAQEAGAVAAVVLIDGESEATVVMRGDGDGLTIPVVSVTGETARTLPDVVGAEVRVVSARASGPLVVHNVIAQTSWGDPDSVVIAGAHLDSVTEGPGISDNGSGSAALLAAAEHLADDDLPTAVRFAWWGAEEIGLIGSTEYVQAMTQDELAAVTAYLNMDMVASPNYVFGVYDSDGSLGSGWYGQVPPGSAQVEQAFVGFFSDHGLPYEEMPLDGRSDYDAFVTAGIPSGGLFTGADEMKTAEHVERYGGDLGRPLDPCYHEPCDTLDNIDRFALTVNTNALVAALRTLADGAVAMRDADGGR